MVPFVAAMNRFLLESQLRSNRPRLATAVMTGTQAQFDVDAKLMVDIANSSGYISLMCSRKRLTTAPPQVVQKRKANPTEHDAHKDLLDRMLTAVDTKTGEKMTDDSIVDNVWLELNEPQTITPHLAVLQLITFLIAGHETTSGTLYSHNLHER